MRWNGKACKHDYMVIVIGEHETGTGLSMWVENC